MANRLKTVQYAFNMYTGVIADATTTNLAQTTIYIPETVVSFESVTVDIGFQDVITATGGTITEHRVALQLGSIGYTTITETDDITNSGENLAGIIGPWDFTSYFTSNWSGTSKTCDLQVYFDQNTGTTLGMRNVTAVITVTYVYDDTSSTQLKTVRVPLESLVSTLPTATNTDFGSNQIPKLTGAGGLLPENSVVIRDYFFLIEGNESTSTTADFTLSANIDSGTATTFGTQEAALSSNRFCRWIYTPTVPSTTSTHNFQLWSTVARVNHVTVTLVITYQYNASASTTILNSILLPIEVSSPLGATTAGDASRFGRDFFIEEPGTISLQQSGFRINYNVAASPTGMRMRAGSQAFRVYTPSAGTAAGMFCLQQRVDSGSEQGSGLSISRGKNSIVIDGYITVTTNQMTNINGYVILNYHSDKSSLGVGAHSHTVMKNLLQWDAALTDRLRINNYSFSITSSNYWIVSAGFIFYQFVQTASQAITFDVECLTTEGKGGGYYDIYADAYQSDNERANSVIWMRGRDVFKRYPNDPDPDRLDIEVPRAYRLFTSTTSSNGLMTALTYHSISTTVSGTISGSAGGTVTIETYRTDTGEKINQTSRAGDGTYSFEWYDDTVEIYTVAFEDTTHFGRSDNVLAGVSPLDIRLSSPPVVRSFA